jgi:hypothetical protein
MGSQWSAFPLPRTSVHPLLPEKKKIGRGGPISLKQILHEADDSLLSHLPTYVKCDMISLLNPSREAFSHRTCLSGVLSKMIKFHCFRIAQGRFLMFGVPNSLPSFPMEVSILKFDRCHSNCLAASPSGNHHPKAALTTRG